MSTLLILHPVALCKLTLIDITIGICRICPVYDRYTLQLFGYCEIQSTSTIHGASISEHGL